MLTLYNIYDILKIELSEYTHISFQCVNTILYKGKSSINCHFVKEIVATQEYILYLAFKSIMLYYFLDYLKRVNNTYKDI